MSFVSQLARRSRIFWLVLFALSPLAYAACVWLMLAHDPNTNINLQLDRDAAISTARDFAAGQNVDVRDWTSGVRVTTDNNRYFYFRNHATPTATTLRRFAPELILTIHFIAPDGNERFVVTLAPDGTPAGFAHTLAEKNFIADADETAARSIADDAARKFASSLDVAVPPAPEVTEDREAGRTQRDYAYRFALAENPELTLTRRVTVTGNQITGEETVTKVDEQLAGSFYHNQITSKLSKGLYGLVFLVLILYAVYRYLQLTRQKEIPHARVLVLGFFLSVMFGYYVYLTDTTIEMPGRDNPALFYFVVFCIFLFSMLMGVFLSVAYGSGEGDIRAAYPGTLTSIDALLTGRVASRNVARSVLIGVGLGGWLVLLRELTLTLFAARADAGHGIAENSWGVLLGKYVEFLPVVQPLTSGVMVAVFGLLLPLSLLRRRLAKNRRWFALVALLSILANLGLVIDGPVPFVVLVLQACITTLVLFVAFFKFDLLAAITATGIASSVHFTIYLIAQPAASLRQAGYISIGLALIILAFELICLRRGRTFTEIEVRPLYAKHLAERVQMQAEVDTAREAQIRLLPEHLPNIAGLEIAAACQPARTVGGDFYDLFLLDENRIGIFVAEGNERGLEAALTIAYAKGFLMPRIHNSNNNAHTPGDIVCDLQTQLQPMLNQERTLGVAYAVVNTAERTLSYARTGTSPRFFIERFAEVSASPNSTHRRRSSAHAMRDDGIFERAERSWSADVSSATNTATCAIREATIELESGDTVLITTDGISKLSDSDTPDEMPRRMLQDINKYARQHAANHSLHGATSVLLQEKLVAALRGQTKHARRIGLEDDMTAVVLHITDATRNDNHRLSETL